MAYEAVDADQLDAGLTTVADALRAKSGSAALLSFPDGMAAEADAVFEAGKKAEYDAFWNVYQSSGTRTDYSYAFFGPYWTDESFYPKYDIVLTGNSSTVFKNSGIADLKNKLIRQGVGLDTSNFTHALQMFQGSAIKEIPEMDFSKVANTSYAFGSNAAVETIDKLIVSENTELSNTAFQAAYALVNITFEGTIARSVDLHWSPLSKASFISTVSALSDTATGLTASFSLDAVNTAFETAEGAADGSESEEWLTLAATKSNWTISLV